MTPQELQARLEAEGFDVHTYNDPDHGLCAELESWTDGGVNMLLGLYPFNLEQLEEAIENFDIDEEIDLYRQNPRYKADFTIRQSLEDFEDYHTRLTLLLGKLKQEL